MHEKKLSDTEYFVLESLFRSFMKQCARGETKGVLVQLSHFLSDQQDIEDIQTLQGALGQIDTDSAVQVIVSKLAAFTKENVEKAQEVQYLLYRYREEKRILQEANNNPPAIQE